MLFYTIPTIYKLCMYVGMYTNLHYLTLLYPTLQYTTLHYPTLPYTTLPYPTYTALHCTVNRALILLCETRFSDPGYMSSTAVSRIEFIRYKLSNFSAHVSRVSEKPLRKGSEQSDSKTRAALMGSAGARKITKIHAPRAHRWTQRDEILIR